MTDRELKLRFYRLLLDIHCNSYRDWEEDVKEDYRKVQAEIGRKLKEVDNG